MVILYKLKYCNKDHTLCMQTYLQINKSPLLSPESKVTWLIMPFMSMSWKEITMGRKGQPNSTCSTEIKKKSVPINNGK